MKGGLPFETSQSEEGDAIVTFITPLTYENASQIWESLGDFLRKKRPPSLVLDLSGVERTDSAGVALLRAVQRSCSRSGIHLRCESLPPSAQHFLRYIESTTEAVPPEKSPVITTSIAARFGDMLIRTAQGLTGFIRFLGNFLVTTAACVFRFRRFRWKEMLYYLQLSGANALGIVFMVSFLLGVVMAYQAAIQLRQFGANIFVADLVSLALTRELAPVFTAMLLAGRSGSAYAAEIGTMKVGEELDALAVLGFNLTEFITVPKVVALMISGPLLTMWANFSGILGGIAISRVSLDLTAYSFLYEVYQVLEVSDIVSGLIKAEFFAILIALIGCFKGFQTTQGADSVGRQTTSAVVNGIFFIIFADALFTVLFHAIGW